MRQGVRILSPAQYFRLRDSLDPNLGYRLITDALLHTGMRVVEFWALVDHPEWYHARERLIDLPKEGASKKPMSSKTDRTIRLTVEGCKALELVFGCHINFRERSAMGKALKRAAERAELGSKGITPKMFRKMLASFLVEVRKDLGIDLFEITANMGHEEKTLRDHYLGIGFSAQDHADILEFLKGWRTAE
jgi:integrase